jgi:serine/threonine-protein kinase
LSPEAALGQEVDKRTDIFAVGIILWELLAGQRLFLGDTDFQTVKKVQIASVPPISQINRKVPPELERIVKKALAKDMLARYGTSQELGQDLSRFMFSYGQPISSYDIATIVQGTMREKQRVRPPQGSIIDKLIEEALFEFTSLKEDGAPASENMKSAAAAPLNTDSFVDPTNWANEIAIGEVKRPDFDPLRASLPPEVFEQGNLSALEDAEPMPASNRAPAAAPSHASQPLGQMPSSLALQMPSSNAQRSGSHAPWADRGGPGGAALGVVLFLVVAAAGAAAWFTGLIPHH